MKRDEFIGRLEEIKELLYTEGYAEHLAIDPLIKAYNEFYNEMQEDK